MINVAEIMTAADAEWDEVHAQKYERDANRHGYFGTLRALLQLGPQQKRNCVVDLGAGTGISSIVINELFHPNQLVVVEPAASMLAIAKERLKSLPHVRYVQGVGENLAESIGNADVVVGAGVLNYFREPDLALDNIYTVLPKDGEVYLSLRLSVGTRTLEDVARMSGIDPNYSGRNWTQVEVEKLLEKHRLRVRNQHIVPVMKGGELLMKNAEYYAKRR